MRSIIVRAILLYLKVFAKFALIISKPTVIGITGSAGKTSTRDAIYAALKNHKKTYVIKKGNSETGMPLGILGLKTNSIGFDSLHRSIKDWSRIIVQIPFRLTFLQQFDYVIVEMGIDSPHSPKNMDYLLSIVKPHISIVLNVHATHAEPFERVVKEPITDKKIVAAIAQEKAKIITHNKNCMAAIYNADSEALTTVLANNLDDRDGLDIYSFGTGKNNAISYTSYTVSTKKTSFGFLIQLPDSEKTQKITVSLPNQALPQVFREVFAAAMLVGMHVGMQPKAIAYALEKNYKIEPGRSTLLHGIRHSIILDSSYNASRSAVLSTLELAYTLAQKEKRPLVFLFGDMRELGVSAKREHSKVAQRIEETIDYLYTVGPLTKKYIYKPLHKKRQFKEVKAFKGTHEAGKYLKAHLPENALVLVKGSQNTLFLEEAIKYLLSNADDTDKLPRQQDYWLRKKHFVLG